MVRRFASANRTPGIDDDRLERTRATALRKRTSTTALAESQAREAFPRVRLATRCLTPRIGPQALRWAMAA